MLSHIFPDLLFRGFDLKLLLLLIFQIEGVFGDVGDSTVVLKNPDCLFPIALGNLYSLRNDPQERQRLWSFNAIFDHYWVKVVLRFWNLELVMNVSDENFLDVILYGV